MKRRRIKNSIVGLLLVVILGGSMISCNDNKKEKEIKVKINEYLEDTYGEEFVVEDLIKHSNAGFSGKYYSGKAYKKSDPSIKFDVQWDVGDPGEYNNNYLEKKWSKQGTEDIKKKLKEIYGQEISLYFVLSKKGSVKYKDCDYKELLAKSEGDLYFQLVYYIPCNGELDKKKEVENLNKIIEPYIKENKIKIFSFMVYYLKSENSDKIVKDLIDKKAYYLDIDESYKEGKLINAIRLGKLDKVSSKEDIIKNFKY